MNPTVKIPQYRIIEIIHPGSFFKSTFIGGRKNWRLFGARAIYYLINLKTSDVKYNKEGRNSPAYGKKPNSRILRV